MAKKLLTQEEAIDKLWRIPNLSYKLKGVQKEMRQAVYDSKGKRSIFLCSRRLGKTFVMMLIAIEFALKEKNSVIKVLLPKKKDAKGISKFQMRELLKDCPKDLMPEWKEADKIYLFQNGSEVQMAGTDGGSAESVRGSHCHLAILDEAGFHNYAEFTYNMQSIIMPTLLTTNGKVILASTPSKEADHPFMTDYVFPARADGSIIEYDIHSNPLITKDQYNEILREYEPLREQDPSFQREFLLRCDLSSDFAVIPEFSKEVERDVVRESDMPAYYDAYVSGDPATADLTAFLFAYYDFLRGKLVIKDELILGGDGTILTTQDIANGVIRKESLNFYNSLTNEKIEPNLRIMDNNFKILINDLYVEHGLQFFATQKDDKHAQVNKVRLMLQQGKIEISPKCMNLLFHIKSARWDAKKTGFCRVEGNKEKGLKPHHCDALDALIYLVRNIDMYKNPYPDNYFEMSGPDIFRSAYETLNKQNSTATVAKSIMNIKR